MGNLKQMGLGHLMYVQNYDGWQIYIGGIEGGQPNGDNTNWYGQLFPTYLSTAKSFECPTSVSEFPWREIIDSPPPAPYRTYTWAHMGIGYAYAVMGHGWTYDKLSDVVNPQKKVLLCDSYGDEFWGPGYWAYAVDAQGTGRTVSDRHNKGANVLHFDGHVGWYTKEYLNALPDWTGHSPGFDMWVRYPFKW